MLIFINSDPEETRTLDLRRDRAALQPTEPPGQIKVCTFKTTYMLHPNGIILPLRESGSHFITAFLISWSSPHPISNSQLHVLPHFHPCPIYLVVFKGVYFFRMGHLILRGASRLDAFSVYPFRTWLPGRRLGSLTGTPAVRPSRSSRTKDSSSQISYAHAG